MARAKKEAALTPEERLQAALVPDCEWPYKLPENWCWTKLGVISAVKGGKRLPKGRNLLNNKTVHPYIRVTDFDSNSVIIEQVKYIDEETFHYIQNYTISSKDIYISIAGTIGKVGIIPDSFDGANLTENAAKITDINGINQKYLLWVLNSEFAQLQMKDSTISTTQPKLALFRIENIEIPIPPLAEQQRIVDRIESLFAKLDEANEKAQAVVDSFETRKAAILHKAFTGELTAKWREEHGVGMESWETAMLSDVGEVITGSTPDTKHPEFYGGDVPFIKPTELNQGRHVAYSADSLTEEGKKVSRPIRAGTTCICCIGAISKCGFLEVDAVTNQQINSVVPYSFMDDAYVYYYCCSSGFKNELISNASATTLPIINKKKTSLLNITYPEKPEQTEIVRILDDLFAKEQRAKEAAEAVLDQIDLMKKSILARAFRGELGTNDPNDEPAVELLKKIL